MAHALLRGAAVFLEALARGKRQAPPAPPPPRASLSAGLRQAGLENRCPVCQASFRGARICPRCGGDLEPLMLLSAKAWQLRQAARQALDNGDASRALGLAAEAQRTQDTGSGEALLLLNAWLTTEPLAGRQCASGAAAPKANNAAVERSRQFAPPF